MKIVLFYVFNILINVGELLTSFHNLIMYCSFDVFKLLLGQKDNIIKSFYTCTYRGILASIIQCQSFIFIFYKLEAAGNCV